jgi:hypothetical protein
LPRRAGARRLHDDRRAGDAPDFRTISDFRKRHLPALKGLFVQVLLLCEAAGLAKLGHVAFDTKIRSGGHASPYRLRKQVVEPVFGQIKRARGFRAWPRPASAPWPLAQSPSRRRHRPAQPPPRPHRAEAGAGVGGRGLLLGGQSCGAGGARDRRLCGDRPGQGRRCRQFLLRGIEKVRGEWALACTAHNLLKLAPRWSLSAATPMPQKARLAAA